MAIVKASKTDLFREIEELPPSSLVELHDFIRYLKFKQKEQATRGYREELRPERDPILQAIGLADVEPFSPVIDDILYGEAT
ncbi:MAG: hypothetical protein GXP42_06095 [Chloroflexi bacterium]|nr:hypothetical protein [Chloroflexota bacterium]